MDGQRWQATDRKDPTWRTMMATPEVSKDGVKKPTHMEKGRIEPYDPVHGSGRPQSEIS